MIAKDITQLIGATPLVKINRLIDNVNGEVFAKLESLFAWTLWELGAAKVNPETLGIPKP